MNLFKPSMVVGFAAFCLLLYAVVAILLMFYEVPVANKDAVTQMVGGLQTLAAMAAGSVLKAKLDESEVQRIMKLGKENK